MSRAVYPHVYRAIHGIAAEFAAAGIAKSHTNIDDQYQYRSIDDVTARLAPLLAKYHLCVLPRVLRRRRQDCTNTDGQPMVSVDLLVAYDFVSSRDGSSHRIQAWGEALDCGDKGTPKAMSVAFKSAILQAFCIPVPCEDADTRSHRVGKRSAIPEPPQGWSGWSEDMAILIASCESPDALNRLRSRRADELIALKRSRPDLYSQLGECFTTRSSELSPAGGDVTPSSSRPLEKNDA